MPAGLKTLFVIAVVLLIIVRLTDAIGTLEMLAYIGGAAAVVAILNLFTKGDNDLKAFTWAMPFLALAAAIFLAVFIALPYVICQKVSAFEIPPGTGATYGEKAGEGLRKAIDTTTVRDDRDER